MVKKKINKHIIIAWSLTMGILIIDAITTIKGLSLGAIESNPISAFFFSLGTAGHILQLIFAGITFLLVLIYLINFCSWLYKKMSKRKMSKKFKIFLYYFFAIGFMCLEVWVICNNMKVISILGGW